MNRTTLRTIIGKANKQQAIQLPRGIRRITARTRTETESIIVSLNPSEVELGIGDVATFQTPWDSGSVALNTGPLFVLADRPGVFVEVNVFHASPDTADPGQGGGSGTDGEVPPNKYITKQYILPPTSTAFENVWTHGTASWQNLSAVTKPNQSATVTLTSSTPVSQYLVAQSFLPVGGTLTGVSTGLWKELVFKYDISAQGSPVRLRSARIVRNGVLRPFDYVTANGPGNSITTIKRSIELKPLDKLLWNESWSTSDFQGYVAGNPPEQFTFVNTYKIQTGSPGKNEIQRITLPSTVSGGTFTLTFAGQTTGAIAYNASAATMKSALEVTSTIAVGDVDVTLNAASDWSIEFKSTYAGIDVPILTADGSSLTLAGGGGPINITTVRQGIASTPKIYEGFATTITSVNDIDTTPRIAFGYIHTYQALVNNYGVLFPASYTLTPTLQPGWTADELKAALESLPNVGVGNVEVILEQGTATATRPRIYYWRLEVRLKTTQSAQALAVYGDSHYQPNGEDVYLPRLFLDLNGSDTSTWSPPDYTGYEDRGRFDLIDEGGVVTNALQTLSIEGKPTGGTFTLTFQGQTTAANAYNISNATLKTNLEALSNISASDITISGGPLPNTPIFIAFGGTLAGTDVLTMTATPSLSGAAPAIQVTQEANALAKNDIQKINVTIGTTPSGSNADDNRYALVGNFGSGNESSDYLHWNAESTSSVETAILVMATPASGDIIVTGTAPNGPFTVEFTGSLAEQEITLLQCWPPYMPTNFGIALSFELIDPANAVNTTVYISNISAELRYARS